MSPVLRLARIILPSRAPLDLARFYVTALGFTHTGTHPISEPALGELLGLPGAQGELVSLRLGAQRLGLLRTDPAGLAYPADITPTSTRFQHFAMTVGEMAQAQARLQAVPAWQPISRGGPQQLPPASGGITAFKFRDPEGHPLELIAGAAAPAGQINHSAISVQSARRSAGFYEGLGLKLTGATLNVGIEQDRLDGVPQARVAVKALSLPDGSAPHLELLCYGDGCQRPAAASAANDIAAAWLVFTVRSEAQLRALLERFRPGLAPSRFADGTLRGLIRDPDGHWLCLELPGASGLKAQPPVAKPG